MYHKTIENYVECVGLLKKLDIWVTLELKETHLTQKMSIYDMDLKYYKINFFEIESSLMMING